MLYRLILIVSLILLALWQLYPTFNLTRLNKEYDAKISQLQDMAELNIDIINDAIKFEESSFNFYKNIADITENKFIVEFTTELAKQELIHKQKLEKLLKNKDKPSNADLIYRVELTLFMK